MPQNGPQMLQQPVLSSSGYECVWDGVSVYVHDSKCTCLSGCLYTHVLFILLCIVQVKTEFSLLCGESAVETITKNLLKFAPKLLQCGGHQVPETIEEDDMMKVMETIDKSLRGSGQGAKAPGVYSLHEVSQPQLIMFEFYLIPFHLNRLAQTFIVYSKRRHILSLVYPSF